MNDIITDYNLSDEELKYNLIKIIHERRNKSGIQPFELQGVISRQNNLEHYIPIENRNYFLLYKDESESDFKLKLKSLIEELKRDGWVVQGIPGGESFFDLTPKGKEKFEKEDFNDWKQITSEFIDSTIPLIHNKLLKEYFKEAWICYNNQRLKISPIFLLGAVSEGVINNLLKEYGNYTIRANLNSFSLSGGIARNFSQLLNHFKNNNVKNNINSNTPLTKEELNALNELENYCNFFFTIYRHSRNDTGHLKEIEITREQIKVYFVSFKKYLEYISKIIDLLNK